MMAMEVIRQPRKGWTSQAVKTASMPEV